MRMGAIVVMEAEQIMHCASSHVGDEVILKINLIMATV